MELRVIGTGSSGNAYVLADENGNVLILDAGVKAKRIFAGIKDDEKVCGCLVTHEHNDHSRAVPELILRGVTVGMSEGTMKSIALPVTVDIVELTEREPHTFGVYKVLPFGVQHDALEPLGFLIEHTVTREKILYVTDTYYLKYTFPNVNYWVVECNYVDGLIRETNVVLRQRLLTSHLSLRRLMDVLRANDLTNTSRIIIVHLSDSRSDEEMMVDEIEGLTGIETIPARAGETIRLDVNPF